MTLQIGDVRRRTATGELRAFLFDLDGVITNTATLHAAAWKRLFDAFLEYQAGGAGFTPFRLPEDYLAYVDGKARYDGVQSFLESRGIELPCGTPADSTDAMTVCGLGNRKDEFFMAELSARGVAVFDGTLRLIEALRGQRIATACVSSSKNCRPVLERCGALGLFDVIVDGTAVENGLAGKPAPDSFLHAAAQLDAKPAQAAVIEDALSGVAAGRAGGFGLVIGVDRGAGHEALHASGADIVVDDLDALLPLV